MKYYFEFFDSEKCYEIDYFHEQMRDNEISDVRKIRKY